MRTYSVKDADKWLNVVASTMKNAAKRGLLAAANRAVAHIKVDIIPSIKPEPTNKGVAKAGWRAEQTENGAAIINTVLQAVLMEEGVRAENVKIGRKMIDALTEWVKAKGIGGSVTTNKSGQRKVTKPSDAEARAIAWAIAKALKQQGIFNKGKGFGILAKAEKVIPGYIRDEVARELKREFQ